MGQGFLESDDDYQKRVSREAYEQRLEDSTGHKPKQGFLESDESYHSRIADEANSATLKDLKGLEPSQGWFERNSDYRERIAAEANEAIIEKVDGSGPKQGFWEGDEKYHHRLRHEANVATIADRIGDVPKQGFFESEHSYRGRVSLKARESSAVELKQSCSSRPLSSYNGSTVAEHHETIGLLDDIQTSSAGSNGASYSARNSTVFSIVTLSILAALAGVIWVSLSDGESLEQRTSFITLEDCSFHRDIEREFAGLTGLNEGESAYKEVQLSFGKLSVVTLATHYESKEVFFLDDLESVYQTLSNDGWLLTKHDYTNEPNYTGPTKVFFVLDDGGIGGYSAAISENAAARQKYGRTSISCGL